MSTDTEHSLGSPEVAVQSVSLWREEKKFKNNHLQSNRLERVQKAMWEREREREMRNVATVCPSITFTFHNNPLIWIKFSIRAHTKSWDSSVGIGTGYGLDDQGSSPDRGKSSSSPQRPQPPWGHQVPDVKLFIEDKAVRTLSWTLTSIYCRGQE